MKNELPKIITIDGPAGAGKSTVAKLAAESLGWIYITTGAIYRTLGLLIKESGIPFEQKQSVERFIGFITERYRQDHFSSKVFIGEREVTSEIRKPEISEFASIIAKDKAIRDGLLSIQRKTVFEAHGAIVDGRDMGTVVFPDAPLKIFLTASPEVRAQRRFLELSLEQKSGMRVEDLAREIHDRDQRDEQRSIAPLKPASDAVIIDSTNKTANDIQDMIIARAKEIFF